MTPFTAVFPSRHFSPVPRAAVLGGTESGGIGRDACIRVSHQADRADMTKAEEWSDAIVSAMMPVYNNEERKFRSGSVKRSTGMSHPIHQYVTYDPTW